MKKLLLTAAVTASSLALAAPWKIDSSHSGANFGVKHLQISTVNGSLGTVSGTVDIDEKDVTKSKVDASIDVKDINTKEPKRDDHLRSPDFFDVAKFPTVTFKSTRFEKGAGNKVKVTGDLTMHGVTKSVTLDGELSGEVTNPWGGKVRAFSGTTTINRKDFGLGWNKTLEAGGLLVGEEVKVDIEAELNPVAPAAAPAAAPAKK